MYVDKNKTIVKEKDYLLIENEFVCMALKCDDGRLLYEELIWKQKTEELCIKDNPWYPDSCDSEEIEVISYEKAIELLKN